jgi:GT2 family glycosyltransferase
LNPDVRLVTFELAPLIAQADDPRVGACAPLVRSDAGAVEDSARRLLTAGRMIGRLLGWVPRLDYEITGRPIDVDWLAGIFILFRRDAFAAIQGFDERYFMYCEDADLCARLRMSGYSVRLVPGSVIVHRAQRASHRRLRYSYWHIRSLIRFLFGQYRSRLHSPAAVVRLR